MRPALLTFPYPPSFLYLVIAFRGEGSHGSTEGSHGGEDQPQRSGGPRRVRVPSRARDVRLGELARKEEFCGGHSGGDHAGGVVRRSWYHVLVQYPRDEEEGLDKGTCTDTVVFYIEYFTSAASERE